MSEEKMLEIIKEQIYLENGERMSYIDIYGDECREFIEAIVFLITVYQHVQRIKTQLLNEKEENKKTIIRLEERNRDLEDCKNAYRDLYNKEIGR